MPNKTIYLRDEDVPTWEQARALAGKRLSPVLVDGLNKFIEEETQRRLADPHFKACGDPQCVSCAVLGLTSKVPHADR